MNLNIKNTVLFILLFSNLLCYCKDPMVEKKIDLNLKTELIRLKKSSKLNEQITILFKVNEELTDIHHDVLNNNGVKIKTNIGNIYTATIPAKSVYNLAKIRFIDYVQGQKKYRIHTSEPKK